MLYDPMVQSLRKGDSASLPITESSVYNHGALNLLPIKEHIPKHWLASYLTRPARGFSHKLFLFLKLCIVSWI